MHLTTAMYRTFAILCLIAPAFGFFIRPLAPGLKFKHMNSFEGMGTESLLDLPLNNKSASIRGYYLMNRPRLPGGYCSLQLWCRKTEMYRVCPLTDETGQVAGVQINIPESDFVPTYNMKKQGFTMWTTILDNIIVRFYAYFIMFASPDSQHRIASKNATIVLRDENVHYSSFDGELASVSTEESQLDSIYTKQFCVGGQGLGYYYNMTRELECSASTLSPFSAHMYSGKLTAVKVVAFGHFKKYSKYHALFEEVNSVIASFAVPNAPYCMYNEISNHGAISMTIYFTITPWHMTCFKH